MARVRKWIEGTHPEQKLSEVASKALNERLRVVLKYLPLAAKSSSSNIEHVHQLRVASRRAMAALRLFSDTVPRKRARRVRKGLKLARQAAGEARDLDVLGQRFAALGEESGQHNAGVEANVTQRRAEAQRPLMQLYRTLKRTRFKKKVAGLLRRVRWRQPTPEPYFAPAAKDLIRPLIHDFFAVASNELGDAGALHQMRIAGKKLRYAMELLAGAFDASFRNELYAVFEEAQERLGIINDHVTAVELLSCWREQASGLEAEELDRLIIAERNQTERTACAFREWWTRQRAEDLARQFERVLAEPGKGNGVAPLRAGRAVAPGTELMLPS